MVYFLYPNRLWKIDHSHFSIGLVEKVMKRVSILGLFALLVVPVAAQDDASRPSFIQDDYTAALAQARQRNMPIFVECWAPW